MAEWWICLVMPPQEVEQIARFKTLKDEQWVMLLSATKIPHEYTEGVILSEKGQALFRGVPPSLYLELGMTEKKEKTERRQITNYCAVNLRLRFMLRAGWMKIAD